MFVYIICSKNMAKIKNELISTRSRREIVSERESNGNCRNVLFLELGGA